MDLSRVSQGEMVAGVGGVLLFISLFLSWFSGGSTSVGGFTVSTSANAFDAFSFMWILMLVIAILVVGVAVASATGSAGSLPPNAHMIVAILGVLLFGWTFGWDIENDSAGVGSWLALVASMAIAFGGYDASRAAVTAARPRRTVPAAPPAQGGSPPGSGPPPSGPPPSGRPASGPPASEPPPSPRRPLS